MANTIKLFSISELLGMNFFIPSYQRGYRWTKQQVEDLLNDIYSFAIKDDKTDAEFYCLQPIVVKEQSKLSGWELVDGQQRLTTLRILLTYLEREHLNNKSLESQYGKRPFTLHYETGKNTDAIFDKITEDNDENIDFHHISRAYKYIREWFEKKEKQHGVRSSILNTLVHEYKEKANPNKGVVQVIWYEIQGNTSPIDTFIRINLGKISLTSSELIKALLLQGRNFGSDNEIAKLRQLEIATEWDRIENFLHDEDFWWFLNKAENNKPARIEFIFDIIRSVAIKENPEIEESIGKDKYSTFRYYYKKFEKQNDFQSIKKEWSVVTEYFNTFLEWYKKPVWYHYIGFLIYCGDNIIDLYGLTKPGTKTKDDITKALKKRIKKHFEKVRWLDEGGVPFLDLSFNKEKQKVKEILLLFNLVYLVKQNESKTLISKFPFKSFKEELWDVEHIDSYTENPLKEKVTQIEWLKTALADLAELSKDKNLINRINLFVSDVKSTDDFESIQNEIIKLAGEETNDENTKNNIGNLTLLDASTNRSYGNSLFPTKRRVIIEKDKTGTFIPICTKNAFLKYFDLKGDSRAKWTESDIKAYRNIIADTLIDFLPIQPVATNEQI